MAQVVIKVVISRIGQQKRPAISSVTGRSYT